MEFSIEKMLHTHKEKVGKKKKMEGIELPNHESIRTLREKITSTWEYSK